MRFLFPIALVLITLTSCRNDKAELLYPTTPQTCDTTNVSYSVSIKPILQTNCSITGCHNAAGAPTANGYNFDTYDDLNRAWQNGALIPAILHQGGIQPMPNNGLTVPVCDINKIVAWTNQGALNN